MVLTGNKSYIDVVLLHVIVHAERGGGVVEPEQGLPLWPKKELEIKTF